MNRYIIIGIGLVVIIGALFFGVFNRGANTETSSDANTQQQTSKSDFDQFASIALVDYDNNALSLEKFRGKPLVINSWAVWCPFCVKELRDFAALQNTFPDKIVVIAVDRAEPLEKAKGFTDELGISDDLTFLLDKKDDFYKTIGGFSMPETLFIDESGAIVLHKRGPMTLEEMKERVENLLK